jgi:hypothetical protein
MAKRLVTVNDVLDGQVALDLECPDRVYLNGYVPNLQVAGQIVVKDLKNADKALRSQHASQIREFREQVTTLHISRFQDDNDRLVRRLETAGDNVTPLSGRR